MELTAKAVCRGGKKRVGNVLTAEARSLTAKKEGVTAEIVELTAKAVCRGGKKEEDLVLTARIQDLLSYSKKWTRKIGYTDSIKYL